MTAIRPRFWAVLAILVLALQPVLSANASEEKASVHVDTVEQLYSAVNDPRNTDTEIVVAPGKYKLSASDPDGKARLNGGRLELQSGADLIGQNRYRADLQPQGMTGDGELIFADVDSETIIDASLLPSSSFPAPAGRGVIRIGRNNRVTRLTVRNSAFAVALIAVDRLPSAGGMNATVSWCVLENANVAVDFRHFQSGASGRDSALVIERSVIRHQTAVQGFGFGIRLLNNPNVQDSTLRATIRRNRIYGNVMGLHAEALGSSDHDIVIDSQENIYEKNGTGVGLEGGIAGTTGAQRNRLEFRSQKDAIWGNYSDTAVAPDAFQIQGGVVIRAGFFRSAPNAHASDNVVVATFDRPRFENPGAEPENGVGNVRRDVILYGAYGALGTFAGKRNRVEITIVRGESDGALNALMATDAQPADGPEVAPEDRNRVIIVASNLPFGS